MPWRPIDLEPLWAILAKKHLVMHGSDFDLRLLHDLCGFRAHSLFDTMLAAQLLGRQRIGLAAAAGGAFRREARQGQPERQLVQAAR